MILEVNSYNLIKMIRDLVQFDRQNWEKLYIGYAEFYKVPMNNEILDTVWSWLFNKKHVVNRLCYEQKVKSLELLIIEPCQDH